MKKTKTQRLSLNKETLRVLDAQEASRAGGMYQAQFTYTLSLGDRCQKSHDFTDGYTCRCEAIE